jgi:hypothetical protein
MDCRTEALALEQERIRLLDHIIYAAQTCKPGIARVEIQLTIGKVNRVRNLMAELGEDVETWETIVSPQSR